MTKRKEKEEIKKRRKYKHKLQVISIKNNALVVTLYDTKITIQSTIKLIPVLVLLRDI